MKQESKRRRRKPAILGRKEETDRNQRRDRRQPAVKEGRGKMETGTTEKIVTTETNRYRREREEIRETSEGKGNDREKPGCKQEKRSKMDRGLTYLQSGPISHARHLLLRMHIRHLPRFSPLPSPTPTQLYYNKFSSEINTRRERVKAMKETT
ncbi:hypothetical protein Pcinc_036374 [Petrolisthes cinctipes]|uniref:Uncharacterized protein n=1 Tax=Petrolisthes cinctipes TaxID=88211 RepID=A0AAE1BYQ4_PETCI|nr:hypothetical protein Pcinc_036374 [Petrolisthes cinctipes]